WTRCMQAESIQTFRKGPLEQPRIPCTMYTYLERRRKRSVSNCGPWRTPSQPHLLLSRREDS
ncbi:hypothetical protein FRC00_005096, partial [Tulasnella sp. 408]